MVSDDFEWDDDKAERNFRDHKVTFEMARDVFDDPFLVEWIDEGHRDPEERFAALGVLEGRMLFVSYTLRGDAIRVISARRRRRGNGGDTTMKTKHDWSAADALTDEEIHAASLADPDAPPLTVERLASMRRVSRARAVRRALRLSQEEFAARYHIPIGTLRDWEQGRFEPDGAARAYLAVIAREPEVVRRALEASEL